MKKINKKEFFNFKNKNTRKLWYKVFEPLIWTIDLFICICIGYFGLPFYLNKYNCSADLFLPYCFYFILGSFYMFYYLEILIKKYVRRKK